MVAAGARMGEASMEPLRDALEAYHRAPPRVPRGTREPALLYDNLRQVLQFAAGRAAGGQPADGHLQRCAQTFVRHALLRSDANHYEILGLLRGCKEAQVKEHYRLLMRLIHPDFASAVAEKPWPADAASRINLAYETLSSRERRELYDATLDAPAVAPPSPAPARAYVAPTAAQRPLDPAYPRSILKLLSAGFGAVGGLAALAYFVMGEHDASGFLVQRAAAPAATNVASASAPTVDSVSGGMPAAAAATSPVEQVSVLADAPLATVAAPAPPSEIEAAPREPVVAAAAPAPAPAAAPAAPAAVPVATAAPPALVAPVPPPPAPTVASTLPTAPPAPPTVTMAQAHPLIARLLAQAESGTGERMLSLLDRDARSAPSAQSFAQRYANLVGGAQAVKVRDARFRSEPRDGRLVVNGRVTLEVVESASTSPQEKELSLEAEFAMRQGSVVMTRLASGVPQ